MNIEREKLVIPGLKRNYTFFHIADSHVVCVDDNSSDYDREIAEKHTKKWTRNDVIPIDAFEETMEFINQTPGDGLIISGDCADYYRSCIADYIKEKLAECNKDVLYVYGNHEGSDYYRGFDYKITYPDYAPVMQGNPSHWVKEYEGLLVVGIDNSTKDISDEQLDFLREQIVRNIPILLVIHTPIGSPTVEKAIEKWGGGEDTRRYSLMGYDTTPEGGLKFVDLIKADNSIKAIFSGHIHTESSGEYAHEKMQYTAGPTYEKYVRIIEIAGE